MAEFKKLDLMGILKLWNDNGGDLKKMAEALGITAQIPGLIATIPPEACQVIAAMLAPHLPTPQIEVNEIAKAVANMMMPLLKDEVAKMTASSGGSVDQDKLANMAFDRLEPVVKDYIKKLPPISPEGINQIVEIVRGKTGNGDEARQQLLNLGASIKALRDEQEAMTRELVTVTFQAELEKARKEAEAIRQSSGGQVVTGNTEQSAQPQGAYATTMAIVNALVNALPAIADAYSKFRPITSANPGEALLKSYLSGLTQGNKLRVGEAKPEEVAQTALDIIYPQKKA